MHCVKLLSYTIPMYGNSRIFPYGKMLVEHDGEQKAVRFGEIAANGRFFIAFKLKRYYFHNVGSLYNPKFVFDGEEAAQ